MGRKQVASIAVAVVGLLAFGTLGTLFVGPERRGLPDGRGWACFETNAGDGCTRTDAECAAQLAARATSRGDVCFDQTLAWCYTYRTTELYTGRLLAVSGQCFPTLDACSRTRAGARNGATRCALVW